MIIENAKTGGPASGHSGKLATGPTGDKLQDPANNRCNAYSRNLEIIETIAQIRLKGSAVFRA